MAAAREHATAISARIPRRGASRGTFCHPCIVTDSIRQKSHARVTTVQRSAFVADRLSHPSRWRERVTPEKAVVRGFATEVSLSG